jgi:hypothetical protein
LGLALYLARRMTLRVIGNAMKIGPLFKWFGSKWQSAKHYPAPEHDILVEPYAGGAGYALNHCDKHVVIWEDDPNLQALWQWLISQATPADVRDIPIGLSEGTDIRSLGLTLGQQLLLKHWQRTNNVGDCWTISRWGHLPGQWTVNTRSRVAEQIGAIKHWEIVQPIDLIDVPCTWFIDPPYLFNYRYRAGLPKFDFENLASFVDTISRESLVIACEAADKKTAAFPQYLRFEHSHRSVTSRRKAEQSHHSNELVYIRRPF